MSKKRSTSKATIRKAYRTAGTAIAAAKFGLPFSCVRLDRTRWLVLPAGHYPQLIYGTVFRLFGMFIAEYFCPEDPWNDGDQGDPPHAGFDRIAGRELGLVLQGWQTTVNDTFMYDVWKAGRYFMLADVGWRAAASLMANKKQRDARSVPRLGRRLFRPARDISSDS